MHRQSPWLWVPTLYFAEGIPYFLVNNVSVMLLTRMGVANGEMALFTSLLYLPWTLKPLWSPLVDVVKTKRWWILMMQIALTVCFVGLTLSVPHPDAEMITRTATPISFFVSMLVLFWVSAFLSATHDIAADGFYMLALTEGDQSVFVGIRSTFYRLSSIFGQGVLIAVAGLLETHTDNIPLAWQLTLLLTSVIFALITVWHTFFLPRRHAENDCEANASPENLRNLPKRSLRQFVSAPPHTQSNNTKKILKQVQDDDKRDTPPRFAEAFLSFFRKKGIAIALLFMLIYRLPEAFMLKLVNPFLVGTTENGGLGLLTEEVGLVYGTIGVLFLTLGGILGGLYVARFGLKRSLWPMALLITLPDAVYLWLAVAQPDSLWLISSAIALEQFGYGFGFTAYMLYLIWFAEGEYKTSHYALCTAFMAIGMMLPGMVAGYLQEHLGYPLFFAFVMLCCLLTLVVTALVYRQLPPAFGKKER